MKFCNLSRYFPDLIQRSKGLTSRKYRSTNKGEVDKDTGQSDTNLLSIIFNLQLKYNL